jgi:uncharacterized protein (TIGR02266 family)
MEGSMAMQEPKRADYTDRRVHPRVTLKTAVTLSSESNFYTGFTNDISEGGLFISTYNIQPAGAVLDIEFNLPDSDDPIRVQAVVRWVREPSPTIETPGIGVQFVDLTPADRRRIERFVKHRETIFFDVP